MIGPSATEEVNHAIPKHDGLLIFEELAPQVLLPVIQTFKLVSKHFRGKKIPLTFDILQLPIQDFKDLFPEGSLS